MFSRRHSQERVVKTPSKAFHDDGLNRPFNGEFPEIHKCCGCLGQNSGRNLCLAGTLAYFGHTSQHYTIRASKTSAPQRKYAKMLPRKPPPVKGIPRPPYIYPAVDTS